MQLIHMAQQHGWTDQEKLDKLVQALRDSALTFYSSLTLNVRENYDKLAKKFNTRFGPKEPARTVRKQLAILQQKPEEKLEEFAERAQRVASDAWADLSEDLADTVAVEAFLTGVTDKEAAFYAMEKEPETMDSALELVKRAIHNQRVLYGPKSRPINKVRTIQFAESPKPEKSQESSQQEISKLRKEMKTQEEKMDRILEILKRNALTSPRRNANVKCYRCGKDGHFANSCLSSPKPRSPFSPRGFAPRPGSFSPGRQSVGTSPSPAEGLKA